MKPGLGSGPWLPIDAPREPYVCPDCTDKTCRECVLDAKWEAAAKSFAASFQKKTNELLLKVLTEHQDV